MVTDELPEDKLLRMFRVCCRKCGGDDVSAWFVRSGLGNIIGLGVLCNNCYSMDDDHEDGPPDEGNGLFLESFSRAK